MSDNDDSGADSGRRKYGLLGGGVLVVALAALWFFRPWFQPVVYTLFYERPGVTQWILIGVALILLGCFFLAREGTTDSSSSNSRISRVTRTSMARTAWAWLTGNRGQLLVSLGIIAIIGGIFVGGIAGTAYSHTDMADRVGSSYESTDTLPDTDYDNPRILPKSVADEYADNSFQYQRHTLGGGDITYVNGTPHWTYSIEPEGINRFVIPQEGGVYVDMTTRGSDVSVQETQFTYGQGMFGWNNQRWQILKDDYNIALQDTMVVPHNDSQYLVTPYVEHDREFRFGPLPQFYSVQEYGEEKDGLLHKAAVTLGLAEDDAEYGGVKIVHPDGTIEDIEPSEVDDHPVLDGQRTYPYDQTRFEVESMAYKNGIINAWVWHDEQLAVNDAPGEDNTQPFLISTPQGPMYVVAAEPAESGSGVYQIWTADGRTGDLQMMELGEPETGPAASVEYVMTEIDRAGLSPVEPVPVIIDDQLYWQVKVVPDDGRGIRATAFVNADTSDVTMVESDEDVRAYIRGSDVNETDLGDETGGETDDPPTTGSGNGLVITIEYPDGTTEDIVVEEGSTVTVTSATGDE